jgi:transposase-like protein
MPRCPLCDSGRVLVVIGPTRQGLCLSCGARWVQDGSQQRRVQGARPAAAPRSS